MSDHILVAILCSVVAVAFWCAFFIGHNESRYRPIIDPKDNLKKKDNLIKEVKK